MHGFLLNIFLNHSIAITAFIAVVRFKAINKQFRPFIFLTWLALTNETLSLVLIYTKGHNTVNSNIYVLFECILILYQFYLWETISFKLYGLLVLVALFVWAADNLVWHGLGGNNSLFRIVYSFFILVCAVKQVSRLAEYEWLTLIKDPVFLICTAFLMYYSGKIFIEVFNAFRLHISHSCNHNIFTVLYFEDFISNIIYAIAILCIPLKQVFTMPC